MGIISSYDSARTHAEENPILCIGRDPYSRYILTGKITHGNNRGTVAGLGIFPTQKGAGIVAGIDAVVGVIIIPRVHETTGALTIDGCTPRSAVVDAASVNIVHVGSKLELRLVLIDGGIAAIPTCDLHGTVQPHVIEAMHAIVLCPSNEIVGFLWMYGNSIKLFEAKTFVSISDRGAPIGREVYAAIAGEQEFVSTIPPLDVVLIGVHILSGGSDPYRYLTPGNASVDGLVVIDSTYDHFRGIIRVERNR